MATVSSLGVTFTTTAGNKTVTATPAANDLIVIIAANTGRTLAQAPTITDNNASGHGTYVVVSSATTNTSADSLWIYVRADRVLSATSTVFTMTQAGDTGGGIEVLKVTGMSISAGAAARQSGSQSNQSGATTPAPAFPGAGLTGNPCIGAVLNQANPATLTPPASWTESRDVGYATPTTGLETAFRSSGNTNTTITWGSASASIYCDVIVELNSTVPIVYQEGAPRFVTTQAVNRGSAW